MANLSRENLKSRFRVALSTPAYLKDHSFEGRIVFPAVEAMITLARAMGNRYPGAALRTLTQAHFPRILAVDPAGSQTDAEIELSVSDTGISASLLTTLEIKARTMSRTLEHARVTFTGGTALPEASISFRQARKLETECINVPAAAIYRELIPFGPAYQNIVGDLSVSEDGALADIRGGSGEADESLLGSPFVLDAAMHAACVWGQRFAGIVAFPVGFDHRTIHQPTRRGGSYLARIKPVQTRCEPLIFDVWIFDQNGIIHESIGGLRMRDVTRGRMRPPDWLMESVWKKS